MKKEQALEILNAVANAFAEEKNPAAHLVRLKLQSAIENTEAVWSDEPPVVTCPHCGQAPHEPAAEASKTDAAS